MAAEYRDFLPQAGMMPRLTPREVERFVGLGEQGRARFRAGDRDGAAAAYRAQLRIFAANPEPYVSLALIAASRGDDEAALASVHAAVVRGFTDLPALERAEVWGKLAKKMEFLAFQDAIPVLQEIERMWGGWNDFRAETAPEDLQAVLRNHTVTGAIVQGMSPALGDRLTRLWMRAVDRSTAAALEAYVAERPDAEDALEAARRLMEVYAGGRQIRWGVVPDEIARRLAGVATLVLDRVPDGSMRSGALVCRALSAYSERDANGKRSEETRERILRSLQEVLATSDEPSFLALALEGLVRADSEAGDLERASLAYREFRVRHAGDAEILQRVRDNLGSLALWAGGLPEIRATAVDGSAVTPESLRGKVVLVDFWATWCRPCVEEFATLRRIAERHGEDVIVVGVNLDRGEELSEEALRGWLAGRGLPGLQIHDGRSWDSDLVRAFGVREIPFTVVAAPDGSILAISERGKTLERAVDRGVATASAR